MITKELFKSYISHECPRQAWLMVHDQDYLKKLIQALEFKLDKGDVELNPERFDSIYEIMRNHSQELNEHINQLKQNCSNIQKLILEMSDPEAVSRLSRIWFSHKFPFFKRADTLDGSLNGEPIIDPKAVELNTIKYLNDPSVTLIFEGQLSIDGFTARWDALEKTPDGKYRLYEVKGSNGVKKEFIYDLYFQYFVYQKYGLDITEINLVHLNERFSLDPNDQDNISNLFTITKDYLNNKINYLLIDYVKRLTPDLNVQLFEIKKIIELDTVPEIKLKYGCKKCLLLSECHQIDKKHIFNLTNDSEAGGNYHTVTKLINNSVSRIADIDGEMLDKYPLILNTKKISIARAQIDYAKGTLTKKNILAADEVIKELKKYDQKVLLFFDFESASYPIPLFYDMNPWEQVPTQYSMHAVDRDYDISQHDYNRSEKSGGIQHFEYISNPIQDGYKSPDLALLEQLLRDFDTIGIDLKNNDFKLVVFNGTYETGRFERLKFKYPKYTELINACLNNILDLRTFFVYGWIIREDFNGKTGLKSIQKAFINDEDIQKHYQNVQGFYEHLDYDKGPIKNGSIALEAYQSLVRKIQKDRVTKLEQEVVLNALKYYCKIDTWSTVVIYDIIKYLVKLESNYSI